MQESGAVTEDRHVPFKQVSVGQAYSCGIRVKDEALECWGNADRHGMPTATPGRAIVEGPFRQVSVGRAGVCAILKHSGDLRCWGLAKALVPSTDTSGQEWKGPWDQISVGFLSICAVSDSSELLCWGGGSLDVDAVPVDIEVA